MVLSVFICEDNDSQRKYLKKVVSDYIAEKDYLVEFACVTADPLEIIDYLKNNSMENSLYILDVDLQHHMNGIVLAKEIREHDHAGKIIFVTTHMELSYLTFRHKVEAMDYIVKESPESIRRQVYDCLETTYQFFLNVAREQECFQVKIGKGLLNVPVKDILYFESHHHIPHRVIMHTVGRRYEFRGFMKEIVKGNENFFQCHKAYVVNKNQVVSILRNGNYGEAELKDGTILPVSRAKLVQFKKAVSQG